MAIRFKDPASQVGVFVFKARAELTHGESQRVELADAGTTTPHRSTLCHNRRHTGCFLLFDIHPLRTSGRAFRGHRRAQANVCHSDSGTHRVDALPPGAEESHEQGYPTGGIIGFIPGGAFRDMDLIPRIHNGSQLGTVRLHGSALGGVALAHAAQ